MSEDQVLRPALHVDRDRFLSEGMSQRDVEEAEFNAECDHLAAALDYLISRYRDRMPLEYASMLTKAVDLIKCSRLR
jgi:hypothetical protein